MTKLTDTGARININGVSFTAAELQGLEAAYTGLPAGIVTRIYEPAAPAGSPKHILIEAGGRQVAGDDVFAEGDTLLAGLSGYVAARTAAATAAASPFAGIADIDDAKAIAHGLIVDEFEDRSSVLVNGKWGPNERDTFSQQAAEAAAYTADNAAATPLLDAIVAESGETKADLVTAIQTSSAALQTAIGDLMGRKRAKLAAMYALTTLEAVKSYDPAAGWES